MSIWSNCNRWSSKGTVTALRMRCPVRVRCPRKASGRDRIAQTVRLDAAFETADNQSMNLARLHYHFRGVLAALALCALAAQQLVGFALAASPALAHESGFSLCLSSAPDLDNQADEPGSGVCVCTLQHIAAVWLPALGLLAPHGASTFAVLRPAGHEPSLDPATSPPPPRAPPTAFHIA